MKPKNTTLLEKFGFKDTDLTKPKHDEIMVKLLNPDELVKIIKNTYKIKAIVSRCCKNFNNNPKPIINCDKCQNPKLREKCFPNGVITGKYEDSDHLSYRLDIKDKECNYYIDSEGKETSLSYYYFNDKGERINYPYGNIFKSIANKEIKNESQRDLCEKNEEKILTNCNWNKAILDNHTCPFFQEKWEDLINNCPLKTDFMMQYNNALNFIKEDLCFIIKLYLRKIEPEYVVKTQSKFIIGFIDIKATFDDNNALKDDQMVYPKITNFEKIEKDSFCINMEFPFYFEIKTEQPNLGETLRQINTYKEFCPGTYILVTPKTKFKEVFEQNGVLVYELED